MLRLILVLIGVAMYAGLAILGWGGVRPFFSHPALAALVAVLLAELVIALKAGGNLSRGEREDRGNRWVLPVFMAVGLLNAYVPALTDRKDVWTIDSNAVSWLGVFLFAAGGALRLWPVFVLGDRFSGLVAIQPGHSLVTTSVYRYIRNPSYLGLLINMAGWALAFRAAIGLLPTAVLVPPLIARMHVEERLLLSQFGSEYEAYRARTWRLVPGVY